MSTIVEEKLEQNKEQVKKAKSFAKRFKSYDRFGAAVEFSIDDDKGKYKTVIGTLVTIAMFIYLTLFVLGNLIRVAADEVKGFTFNEGIIEQKEMDELSVSFNDMHYKPIMMIEQSLKGSPVALYDRFTGLDDGKITIGEMINIKGIGQFYDNYGEVMHNKEEYFDLKPCTEKDFEQSDETKAFYQNYKKAYGL